MRKEEIDRLLKEAGVTEKELKEGEQQIKDMARQSAINFIMATGNMELIREIRESRAELEGEQEAERKKGDNGKDAEGQ